MTTLTKPPIINIEIEEVSYAGKTYFIGRSKELGGFYAEGDDFKELDFNVQEVIKGLMNIRLSKLRQKLFDISYMYSKSFSYS